MKRLALSCTVAVALLSSTIGFCSYSQAKPAGHSASSGGSLFAKYEGELLSVDIKDASLDEVLHTIADQTGISFSLPASLCKNTMMVRFANFDIDEGIDKVLGAYDRVFIYDYSEDNAGKSRLGKLREVRIYLQENNKSGASEKPITIGPKQSDQNPADTNQDESKQVLKTSPKDTMVKSLKEWSKDLQGGDEATKLMAVQGLARMGGIEAIGELTSALQDSNSEVSKAAESALTDLYASLEDENNLTGSNTDQQQTIEGAPRFAIDASGAINEGTGGQMEVDIRLSEVPEKLITSGFMLTYDPSRMEVIGADIYDGSVLAGPWDSSMTNKVVNPSGPGTYMVIVGNLGSVTPDERSNINIARLNVQCTGSCDGTFTVTPVPDFATMVGNSSTVYDSKMPPSQFRLN
jgi:hypothetical protein